MDLSGDYSASNKKMRRETDSSALSTLLKRFPKQLKKVAYGTAGFRENINLPLDPIFVRMGLLSALRSCSVNLKATGVMITASHNLECDNGVKMVDYDGGMLHSKWETYAEALANAEEAQTESVLNSILLECGYHEDTESNQTPIVIVGRDTRPHSTQLFDYVKLGIESVHGKCIDIGEVTTPQLHFLVHLYNQNPLSYSLNTSEQIQSFVNQYYTHFSTAYHTLLSSTAISESTLKEDNKSPPIYDKLIIDASNGVGSLSVTKMLDTINTHTSTKDNNGISINNSSNSSITYEIRNPAYSGPVNQDCGAEHVQKTQTPCNHVSIEQDRNQLICSFDGDADRVVFHSFLDFPSTTTLPHNTHNKSTNTSDHSTTTTTTATATATTATNNAINIENKWILMDGDKIATLFVMFLQSEFQAAAKSSFFSLSQYEYKFGVVQTAYANGASTYYFKSHDIDVSIAKTGVKYLHRVAHEKYDIGVYFEANGHGTILFSPSYSETIDKLVLSLTNEQSHSRAGIAVRRLKAIKDLINQTVGDAITDMLLSLAALRILKLSIADWHHIYQDLPNKMIKLAVKDKNLIQCSNDETQVLSPVIIQTKLNEVMSLYNYGRSFIRPSGTEDVVRIYAEASTLDEVEKILLAATEIVNTYAN